MRKRAMTTESQKEKLYEKIKLNKRNLQTMNTQLNNKNIFINFPDVVKVKDLQKMLGIGRNLAYELISTNEIKSIKSGNLILIPKQNVIDYLNKGDDNNER